MVRLIFDLKNKYCDKIITDRCIFIVNPGPCGQLIKMYAYDLYEDQCKTFFYSGCGGNPNRFKSFKECRVACNASNTVEEESIEDILETTEIPDVLTV